jgi:DNA polymerase V
MKCYLPEEVITLGQKRNIPFFSSAVAAGFPSPADDYIERKLDLHKHLVKHPAATFFVKASGHSMTKAGILDGDLLVVDRSLEAADGKIVIAALNGELTVKRILKRSGKLFLVPENDEFTPIEVKEEMDLQIWGVVSHVIHSV